MEYQSNGMGDVCRCCCPGRLQPLWLFRIIIVFAFSVGLIQVMMSLADRTSHTFVADYISPLPLGATKQLNLDEHQKAHLDDTIIHPTERKVDVLTRQRERQAVLHHACEALNVTKPRDGRHKVCSGTWVDEKRKFIYCLIQKVSSSSMKNALVNSTAKAKFTNVKQMHTNDVKFLKQYGLSLKCVAESHTINSNINDYFKFLIVRHPLKRLLSAYRDKFQTKHPDNVYGFQKHIGTSIIRKYRKNPSRESLRKGQDVKFEEFLRYVIDTHQNPNGHWQSYWSYCHPCENSYDFIAFMETMDEDVSYILKKVAQRPVPMPRNRGNPRANETTDGVFKKSYSEIAPEVMNSIIKQFEKDFLLFGYDPYIYLK